MREVGVVEEGEEVIVVWRRGWWRWELEQPAGEGRQVILRSGLGEGALACSPRLGNWKSRSEDRGGGSHVTVRSGL